MPISLQEIQKFYAEKLENRIFQYTLRGGQVIELAFYKENLCHLLGIQHVISGNKEYFIRKENAQALSFAGESFDAVVTRNLTWTLPDVMEAYREWQRVLKPGGLLLNFDSDYGMVSFGQKDDPIDVHAGIRKELVTECNDIKDELRISTHRRPGWDVEFLTSLGMAVSLEADIGDRVHVDESMQFDQVPLFCIRACK